LLRLYAYFNLDRAVLEVMVLVNELVAKGEDGYLDINTNQITPDSQTQAKLEVLEAVVKKKFFSGKEISKDIQQYINRFTDGQKVEEAVVELSMVNSEDIHSLRLELQKHINNFKKSD